MCGIVAAVAGRDVVPLLLEGLRRLEYRGYDSAGVAVIVDGKLQRLRSAGRGGNGSGFLRQHYVRDAWGLWFGTAAGLT